MYRNLSLEDFEYLVFLHSVTKRASIWPGLLSWNKTYALSFGISKRLIHLFGWEGGFHLDHHSKPWYQPRLLFSSLVVLMLVNGHVIQHEAYTVASTSDANLNILLTSLVNDSLWYPMNISDQRQ